MKTKRRFKYIINGFFIFFGLVLWYIVSNIFIIIAEIIMNFDAFTMKELIILYVPLWFIFFFCLKAGVMVFTEGIYGIIETLKELKEVKS